MAAPLLWLFDLDNTLHDASHAIFPAIHDNMNRFIAETLRSAGLPCAPDDVDTLRDGYWRRYGATLLGMVRHHQVSPEVFLREAHRFDDLAALIRTERGLALLLERLPGRKVLLTNAPYQYSRDVLRHLGLHRHFSRHIAIESMRVHRRMQPKPSKSMLRSLLRKERCAASRCILVEDSLPNLKSAKAVGMRTVLLARFGGGGQIGRLARARHPGGSYVDVRLRSLRHLPSRIRGWLTTG